LQLSLSNEHLEILWGYTLPLNWIASTYILYTKKWGKHYKTHLNLTTQGKYITWYPPNINKCQVLKKWAVLPLESKYNYRYIHHQTIYWALGTNYPKGSTYLPGRIPSALPTYIVTAYIPIILILTYYGKHWQDFFSVCRGYVMKHNLSTWMVNVGTLCSKGVTCVTLHIITTYIPHGLTYFIYQLS
jgi:hypothetical protein